MAKTQGKGIPKPVIIIGVLAILLIGGGFFLMNNPIVKKGLDISTGGKFSSIKDALTQSVSLECDYKDAAGSATKVWIKNGAVRADMSGGTEENNGSMIMNNKKMYIWNSKEGLVMEIPDVTPAPGETATETNQADDFIKDLEAYKESCKPAVVSDSLFTPPADVTFTDMSKMMEGMKPSDAGSEGYSEENLQKMMEQYQDNDN